MDAEPRIRIRPLARGESEPVRVVFAGMSRSSRYLRYHTPLPRLTAQNERLLTDVDGRRHAALVAELAGEDGWTPVGIGRVIGTGDGNAEVAFEVVDAWQGRGIGRRMLIALRRQAVALGFTQVVALVLPENRRAAALMRSVFPDVITRRVGAILQLTGRPSGPPAGPAVPDWHLRPDQEHDVGRLPDHHVERGARRPDLRAGALRDR
jgi:RimJ/RimL family protein N-acetyltransferase